MWIYMLRLNMHVFSTEDPVILHLQINCFLSTSLFTLPWVYFSIPTQILEDICSTCRSCLSYCTVIPRGHTPWFPGAECWVSLGTAILKLFFFLLAFLGTVFSHVRTVYLVPDRNFQVLVKVLVRSAQGPFPSSDYQTPRHWCHLPGPTFGITGSQDEECFLIFRSISSFWPLDGHRRENIAF